MGVSIAAGVILAVLGINTYSPLEKEGTLCMLYHHPIPRKNVFLAKVAPNLLCALALSAALAFSIQLASSQSHYRTHLIEYVFEYGAPDVLPSLTVLTLICGVILSLVFRRPHYVLVTGAFAALLFFCYNMQVPDGRAHGYLPFTPLALGGLMFYACGVLMTLSFKRPIYALITTGGAISFAYIVIVYLIEPAAWLGGQLRNRHAYPSESLKDVLGPILLWPSLILFVGLLASAWRTATDRAALTGTEYIRPLYGIRLFGFTLAITVVLTTTGWGDLFYLLTKLDLGLG